MSCLSEAFLHNMSGANYTVTLLDKIEIEQVPTILDVLNIDYQDNFCKEKLLVQATFAGKMNVVKSILSANVSVDADEYNRYLFCHSKIYMTPLQIAAARGWHRCLDLLINEGADLNAKDRFDVTATHMAAEQGHHMCLKLLLEAGANCNAATKYYRRGFRTVPFHKGTTPLHLAASNNHIECVKELIYFGADYNAVDERGRTSLYLAAQAGYEECVIALLTNAVGRDILSLPGFDSGDTPLHFAVRRGMIGSIREMLRLGSDVNHQNYSGISPLHLCVSMPTYDPVVSMEVLKLLVLNGYNTDVNQTDSIGLLPLHYVSFDTVSVMSRRPEMAKFLIALGSNVHITNHQGLSLIQSEYNSDDEDTTLLRAVMDSMEYPPPTRRLRDANFAVAAQRFPHNNRLPFPSLWLAFQRGMDPEIEFENLPLQAAQPEANISQNSVINSKQEWYNSVVSKPPHLAHLCRCVIRREMGPKRLRHVRSLAIPVALQTYLLLGVVI